MFVNKLNCKRLEEILSPYLKGIEKTVVDRASSRLASGVSTPEGDYELIKILGTELVSLEVENDKFHSLFSPSGCYISGKVKLTAHAYPPFSDKLGYTSHTFESNFKESLVRFNFEKEVFEMGDELNITYNSIVK